MKFILAFFLLFVFSYGFSQAIEVRAGHSLTPADYVSLRYEYYTNNSINFSAKVFLGSSNKNNLNYSACGLDLMTEYYSNLGYNSDHKWELKAGLGGTIQIENEPWIYKGWGAGRRTNYGIVGEVAIEWAMTDQFSLTGFVQQKYLFNKALGTTGFAFGIGLKFNLNNF